jgi:hypothetical protein
MIGGEANLDLPSRRRLSFRRGRWASRAAALSLTETDEKRAHPASLAGCIVVRAAHSPRCWRHHKRAPSQNPRPNSASVGRGL